MNTPVTPSSIAPPAANYAHAVLVQQPSAWLHTSGVVPTAPDGSTPDGIDAQAEVVWGNIGVLLAEVGMTTADIVSITTFVVAGHPLAGVMGARDRAMGDARAASTLLTVTALARPEWLMEIAIVAAK
jgi:2-iminobutanoate/2-iminopropanoate deaminase